MYNDWIGCDLNNIDLLVGELTHANEKCVEKVSTTRTITRHSKPWFTAELTERCKKLRSLKRKCRHHRCPSNVMHYRAFLHKTVALMKQAESSYRLTQCGKLTLLTDKVKWKAIDRLTNQRSSYGLQPIRIQRQGEQVYLFEDKEIAEEMGRQYILDDDPKIQTDDILQFLCDHEVSARFYNKYDLMSAPVSDNEVASTFGTGSSTSGPDNISCTLIDKADRNLFAEVSVVSEESGLVTWLFFKDRKLEDGCAIPKPGRDDYHVWSSYRTISITACIGKRFESIASQRLVAVLADLNFDPLQFAYLKQEYNSSNVRPEVSRGGGVIPHKIHTSPIKLALPAARLGGQPSLPWSPLSSIFYD